MSSVTRRFFRAGTSGVVSSTWWSEESIAISTCSLNWAGVSTTTKSKMLRSTVSSSPTSAGVIFSASPGVTGASSTSRPGR